MRAAPGLLVALLCSTFLAYTVASPSIVSAWEINGSGTVERIVDGDTLVVEPVGVVRLADVNAPEAGEPGSREATDYITSLVHHRLVYLDIDDVRGTDPYGRTVAVVYVRHNATHLLNVNAALFTAGVVQMTDYPNEFDPYLWSPYIPFPIDERPDYSVQAAWMAYAATTIPSIVLLAIWAKREMVRRSKSATRSERDYHGDQRRR